MSDSTFTSQCTLFAQRSENYKWDSAALAVDEIKEIVYRQ